MHLDTVAIFGGGTTGGGLAKTMALAGLSVVLVERSRAEAAAARERLEARLARSIEKYALTEGERRAVLARVRFTALPLEARGADLFVESVPELVDVKRRVLLEIERIEPPESRRVKLSNSAVIAVSQLQPGLAAPELVVGFHVLSPEEDVPLVELVRGECTGEVAMEGARALADRLGKRAVTVFESPGYITTRIIVHYLNEAMHALMEGVASAEEIDAAMRAGFGMPRGPLHLADHIGLDQVLYWMENLFRELGDLKYRPCPLLRRMVREGRLGEKSGRGFFEHREGN